MEAYGLDDRLVGGNINIEDSDEPGLRPRSFNEYIGQDKVKDNLMVFIVNLDCFLKEDLKNRKKLLYICGIKIPILGIKYRQNRMFWDCFNSTN